MTDGILNIQYIIPHLLPLYFRCLHHAVNYVAYNTDCVLKIYIASQVCMSMSDVVYCSFTRTTLLTAMFIFVNSVCISESRYTLYVGMMRTCLRPHTNTKLAISRTLSLLPSFSSDSVRSKTCKLHR